MRVVRNCSTLVCIVGLVLASGLYAQDRQKISEKDFVQIADDARNKTYASPYISTMESEGVSNTALSRPDRFIKETFESDGAERSRRVRTTNQQGLPTRVVETIKIGNDEYTRENNSPWKKQTRTPGVRSTTGGSFRATGEVPKNVEKFSFRRIGTVELDGIKVNQYEAEKFREYQNGPNWVYAYTVFETYWIRLDGKLARHRSRTVERTGKTTNDMIVRYEYPETVQIEAPIK